MLRRSLRLLFAAALIAPVGATAGCHRGSAFNPATPAQGAVGLRVTNDNFLDMDVYVVSEGLATRVGTVTGNSTASFVLDPSFFPTQELRIVATPIGGNGRASSGQLNVSPGSTIEFRIGAVLRQSSASVH